MIQLSFADAGHAGVAASVPRLIVTYSRMVLPSPISTRVSSPAYFLSCGGPPIEANWKMRLLRPMRVRPRSPRAGRSRCPRRSRRRGPITRIGADRRRRRRAARPGRRSRSGGSSLMSRRPPSHRCTGSSASRHDVARRGAAHCELPDAAQLALDRHLDLSWSPGIDRPLEARVVDADVVVHRLVVGLDALGCGTPGSPPPAPSPPGSARRA